MKKVLTGFLILTLILGICSPTYVFATDDNSQETYIAKGKFGENGDNLVWTIDKNGVLNISGNGAIDGGNFLWVYNSWERKSACPWWKYRECVKEVIIEEGCTSLCSGAFAGLTKIEKIKFPSSLTTFDEFWGPFLGGQNHLKTVETQSIYNVELKNIHARDLSYKSIELTWDKLENDVKIDIYRDGTKIARVSGGTGIYIDSAVARGSNKLHSYMLCPVVNVNGSEVVFKNCHEVFCGTVDTQSDDTKPEYAAPILDDVVVEAESVPRPGVFWVKIKAHDDHKITNAVVSFRYLSGDPNYIKLIESKTETIQEAGEISIPIFVDASKLKGRYNIDTITLTDEFGNCASYDGAYTCNSDLNVKDEFDIEFRGSLSNGNVTREIQKMEEGKTVLLTAKKETILHKEVLDAIKGQNKTLVIYANRAGTLQWVINGRDITGETKDIDIKVELSTVSAEEYGGVGDTIQLKFADNGVLPCKVNFRMQSKYISAQYDLKTDMHLYYVTNNNISEENANLTVLDMGSSSWCYMDLTHNSTYYLSGVKLLKSPSITSVANTNAGVKVSWNKVKGAKKYVVYYKKSGAKKWTKYKTTTDTTCTVERKKLKAGTKYVFTAKAVASDGNAGKVNVKGKSITWIASPKIESVKNADSGISVKWSQVSAAKTYRVTYKVDGGKWTKYKDYTTTKCTIPTKILKAGKTYSIRVTAITNDKTKSGIASTESIVRLKSVSNITAKKLKRGKVTVSWSKSKGAKGYYIYRKTTKGKWKKIGVIDSASKTSFIDETAETGNKYLYAVRAYNGKSVSAIGTGVAAK